MIQILLIGISECRYEAIVLQQQRKQAESHAASRAASMARQRPFSFHASLPSTARRRQHHEAGPSPLQEPERPQTSRFRASAVPAATHEVSRRAWLTNAKFHASSCSVSFSLHCNNHLNAGQTGSARGCCHPESLDIQDARRSKFGSGPFASSHGSSCPGLLSWSYGAEPKLTCSHTFSICCKVSPFFPCLLPIHMRCWATNVPAEGNRLMHEKLPASSMYFWYVLSFLMRHLLQLACTMTCSDEPKCN